MKMNKKSLLKRGLMFGLTIFLTIISAVNAQSASLYKEDSGVEAALRSTLSYHPILRGKRALVEAKGFASDMARAQRLPSLSGEVASHDNNSNDILVRVRQPLWTFGRIDSGIAYADLDTLTEQADLLRIQRQLMDQTVSAYSKVQGSQHRLGVAEDNIAGLDSLYQHIQRREQGRLASMADVRLARARLVQARSQKARFEGDVSVAKAELLALTQAPVNTEQVVANSLTQLPDVDELEWLAQAASADVLLKKQQISLAQEDVNREKTAQLPTVYLQADHTYSSNANNFNQSVSNSDTRLSIVLEARLDAMGFSTKGRNNAAGARLNADMEDLNTTRNDISRQVSSLSSFRMQQYNLIDTQKQSVHELTEILASYQRQYKAGKKAWLEVLNMQRELTEQRLQYVQAKSDWLTYTLKLASLTGLLDTVALTVSSVSDEYEN
jgi:adhesin transport system outer membrane protein|tara:strand:- start:593 stop:1912 length:1320 start_codon:yes stop_codon:yes gene_type:complete